MVSAFWCGCCCFLWCSAVCLALFPPHGARSPPPPRCAQCEYVCAAFHVAPIKRAPNKSFRLLVQLICNNSHAHFNRCIVHHIYTQWVHAELYNNICFSVYVLQPQEYTIRAHMVWRLQGDSYQRAKMHIGVSAHSSRTSSTFIHEYSYIVFARESSFLAIRQAFEWVTAVCGAMDLCEQARAPRPAKLHSDLFECVRCKRPAWGRSIKSHGFPFFIGAQNLSICVLVYQYKVWFLYCISQLTRRSG